MTVADRVFEAVRNDILTGKISRDKMLSIYQLAETYQVSRTPVREAVLRLANVGLVVVERNHGVRVKGLTASDLREIFHTRLLIEVPSAYYAASSHPPGVRDKFSAAMDRLVRAAQENDLTSFIRADRELHSTIISWNGNMRAARIVDQIRDEAHSLGASTFEDGRAMSEVLAEHVPIYDAILAEQGRLAATLMNDHLVTTARMLLTKLAMTGDDGSAAADIATLEGISPVVFIDL